MIKRIIKRLTPSFLWDRLHRFRAWFGVRRYHRTIKHFPRRVVQHSYGGFPLQITLADPDGELWYDRDWPVLPEIEMLAGNRLRPGTRVFNLGAHQGVVALMLARTVGPGGLVVAVDPNPVNVEVARQNQQLNRVSQLTIVQAAVGSRPGTLRFGEFLNDRIRTSEERGGIIVNVVTLDSLTAAHGPPDIVFLDVEGYECEVLRGAEQTRSRCRTDWFVEVHVGTGLEMFSDSAAVVLEFFPQPDYHLFVASESHRGFVPLEQGRDLLQNRFFLVALDQRPPPASVP